MEKGNRLVFIVEGDCEVAFINIRIIPYLYKYVGTSQWSMNAQKITTNRKMNRKGGNVNYAYLKNEIERVAAQQGNVWITTFMDFFRLPNDFPNYSIECRNIDAIEEGIKLDMGYERLVPYIQKYEFETLLFASMDGFYLLLDDEKQLEQIQKVIDSYENIEDINGGKETAPSKRLLHIFNYDKVVDSGLVLEELDVETMRDKCPRFDKWIESLINIVKT